MHLINSDCVDPDVTSKIKKCISSKESVSCIGPHAIFKVVEALDSSTAFTLNFKTFENLSGVVFSFVDESEKFSDSYEALVTMKSSSTTNVKALDIDRAAMINRPNEAAAFFSIIDDITSMLNTPVFENFRNVQPVHAQLLYISVIRSNVEYMKRLKTMAKGFFKPAKTFTTFAITVINAVKVISSTVSVKNNTLEDAVAIYPLVELIYDRYIPALLALFPMVTKDYPNWPRSAKASAFGYDVSESWSMLTQTMHTDLKNIQAVIESLKYLQTTGEPMDMDME